MTSLDIVETKELKLVSDAKILIAGLDLQGVPSNYSCVMASDTLITSALSFAQSSTGKNVYDGQVVRIEQIPTLYFTARIVEYLNLVGCKDLVFKSGRLSTGRKIEEMLDKVETKVEKIDPTTKELKTEVITNDQEKAGKSAVNYINRVLEDGNNILAELKRIANVMGITGLERLCQLRWNELQNSVLKPEELDGLRYTQWTYRNMLKALSAMKNYYDSYVVSTNVNKRFSDAQYYKAKASLVNYFLASAGASAISENIEDAASGLPGAMTLAKAGADQEVQAFNKWLKEEYPRQAEICAASMQKAQQSKS